ncbi:MAG: 6-bladed beta-propeller [Phycisphaerae bacterium]
MSASLALPGGGCGRPLRPVFDTPDASLAWPPPPAAPRLRYIGQLRAAADLKAPRRVLQLLGDFVAGKKKSAELYGPQDVLCTPDGRRVWIADPGGRCLHLFDLHRRRYRRITHAGGAPLVSPVGLCGGGKGAFFVCDSQNGAIFRLSDRTGLTLAELHLPDALRRPVALYYDRATDELFVVDVWAHDIKVLDGGGRLLRTIGRRGTGPGEFNYPSDIVADDDFIWVADTGNHRVQGLRRSGRPAVSFGRAGDAPGDMAFPRALAVDRDRHVYVVDGRFENLQLFDRRGRLLMFLGEEGRGPGEFWLPAGISIDAVDRIWICDSYNRRVQVFQYLTATDENEHGDDGDQ